MAEQFWFIGLEKRIHAVKPPLKPKIMSLERPALAVWRL